MNVFHRLLKHLTENVNQTKILWTFLCEWKKSFIQCKNICQTNEDSWIYTDVT